MGMEREEAQKYKRHHHTDLRPLATNHVIARRPMSSSPVNGYEPSRLRASSSSEISLAGPSLATVRKYYRDHGLRTAFQTESLPMEHRSHFLQSIPRRHSVLSPGGLATRMESIAVSSPVNGMKGEQVRERRSIAEVSRDMLLDGVNRGELAKLGGVFSRRPSSLHPIILSSISARISSDPTHNRLRAWGPAYLCNAAVADVYVKALQLRGLDQAEASSKFDASEHGGHSGTSDHPAGVIVSTTNDREILVRAKVLPRAKQRKPFLIQRRFNLGEMRASTPISKAGVKLGLHFLPKNDGGKEAEHLGTQIHPRRSKSDSTSTPLMMHAEPKLPNLSYDRVPPAKVSRSTGKRIPVMPIHVEYALHYLPILAALIFSGHVRRGDAIDLPMPHPWAWREVVSYIYTGQGVVTPAMKGNILYLGGRVDE